MSYSTSSPGSETAPVPKRRVAALFTACLLLLTTAGVGVASTAGAAQPRPVENPATVSVTTPTEADAPWGSIKVSWTKPVPSDFTSGYLVLFQPGTGAFDETQAYQVRPVAGLNTTSLIISGLAWTNTPTLAGNPFRATVLATNGEASQSFIDDALTLDPQPRATDDGTTSYPPAVTPPGQTEPGQRYEFPTIDAMIDAHYQAFLGRMPTFVERNLWQDVFQDRGQDLHCDFVDTAHDPNNPPTPQLPSDPALNWGPSPIVTEDADVQGAQNCPNHGTEYDMISILRTGFDFYGDQPISDEYWIENPTTYEGIANPIIRLYFAYFDRVPDQAGFEYWTSQFRSGAGSLDWIANFFANSDEFNETYPTIQTNADFVSMVYFNVLHRAPDATGMAFWVAQIRAGTASKGRVMNQFAQSDENMDRTWLQVQITNIYGSLLQRMPSDNELAANAFWAGIANGGDQWENVWVIQGAVRNSPEYAALQG